MEGTWKRSCVTSYDDGTKSHVEKQLTYTYDTTDKKNNGGTFCEICIGQEETDEDDLNTKYQWVSKIEGTWKIEMGTLYQHYYLSTLEVEIGKDDIDLKYKNRAWLWNDWGEVFLDRVNTIQNIHENLKKETYKELFHTYNSFNEENKLDIGYPNVQVDGDEMSYETSDMDQVRFYRIDDKTNKLNEEKTIKEIYDDIIEKGSK